MIANLPLLFANGNPTALSKIKAADLENFITFMVTCSWGHDTAKDIRQPPWWPADVPFSHPFVRPPDVPKDWESRLKNLVRKCYDYHKSTFLLVFSSQLARYPRNRLRYVDNRDHTTSLYYRPNGRLLVTFRNENLFYDQGEPQEIAETQIKPVDIYLCDYCDSHFNNYDTLQSHERFCNSETEPATFTGGLQDFLSALKLRPAGESSEQPQLGNNNDQEARPKYVRTVSNIDRGPPFPFSSIAYMRNAKSNVQRDMTYSRERVERYCCTSTPLTKNLGSKGKIQQFPVRYRRPIDYWIRKHTFPNQRNKKILGLEGQLLLLKCKPITVDVSRMSIESMHRYIDELKKEAESRQPVVDQDIEFIEAESMQPTVDVKHVIDPLIRMDSDCEVIDLCSDDEGPSVNENCDPRAGVTCVMRGGAVLRRTAATALSSPSAATPCGARQRPLPSTLNHPVILIAHPLTNIQTISID